MGEVKELLKKVGDMVLSAEQCLGNERLARLIVVDALLQETIKELREIQVETRDLGVDPEIVYSRGHEIIRWMNKGDSI